MKPERYTFKALPRLKAVLLEDLRVGDVYWGQEKDRNYPRKGWLVESQGEPVETLEEMDDRWVFNQTHILKGPFCPEYVLIQVDENAW